MSEQDRLSLKWGTLKSWNLTSQKGQDLLKRYFEFGAPASAMLHHDNSEQKELLCQMIDECGAAEIYLSWDGKYVSKEAAKKYVMEYGQLAAVSTTGRREEK